MPKLKKEMFMRPIRFTHRFGDQDDPWIMPSQYFEFKGPPLLKSSNKPSQRANIQKDGLYVHTPAQSPVTKGRGGHAALNGPSPDKADMVAEALPTSTRERRTSGPLAEQSVAKVGKK